MKDRDKSTLECSEKMCEYCCNFDKEHIGMDGMALCKLTMTLAYAEDYGGNCMFYNVPKEQIIVPPCKVGDTVYSIVQGINRIFVGEVYECVVGREHFVFRSTRKGCLTFAFTEDEIGKTVFLSREEAEKALERSEGK